MLQQHLLLVKLFVLLLLGSLLAGCGSTEPFMGYADKTKNIETLVRINGESKAGEIFLFDLREDVLILKVDHWANTNLFSGNRQSVLVEPGRHYLQVKYQEGNFRALGELWLDAEIGKTYIVKALKKRLSVWFWIENEKTGERVGGIPWWRTRKL